MIAPTPGGVSRSTVTDRARRVGAVALLWSSVGCGMLDDAATWWLHVRMPHDAIEGDADPSPLGDGEGNEAASRPGAAEAPERRASAAPGLLDGRDQYQLAQQISAARSRRNALASALADVERSWAHARYRWEVAHVPALCRDPTFCVAMPFDYARGDAAGLVAGWLPQLDLTEQDHMALVRACRSHERCVFTFEGQLDQLVVAIDQPTSLRFGDVKIVETRAAAPGESWAVRRRQTTAERSHG